MALTAQSWTKPFAGVQHFPSDSNGKGQWSNFWATVCDHDSFATVTINPPGLVQPPIEECVLDSAEDAREYAARRVMNLIGYPVEAKS